jgi:hypothetical protein
MMRRRILILAQVSPPSRRSECVIALFEIAGGIIHSNVLIPDIPILAAPTAVRRQRAENEPTHVQPEERIWQ